MLWKTLIILASLYVEAIMASNSDPPPSWPSGYSVSGFLSLPYAEIREKFAAFYDGESGQSRIDYYDGMDKTFQLAKKGKFGQMLKIVPMTDEKVFNQMNCFAVEGSEDSPVEPQSILPDLTGFVLKGEDAKGQKWQKKEAIGQKINKYTMWIKKDDNGIVTPVQYEMKGYNNILGSHYDHYYLEYSDFKNARPNAKVFEDYDASSCHGWPGPGSDFDHAISMNPMQEFIEAKETHVDSAFNHFEIKHNKKYRNGIDRENRKDIFKQNLRYIQSKNRQNLSYKLAPNHLADRTDSEITRLRGRLRPSGQYNGGQPFSYTQLELDSTPTMLDWRLYGAVTPVKDQASCGSCWSFGTVGTLEGANFLKTGELVKFSQQALVDCSWGFGNNGCDGGEDFRVYEFMLKHGGIPTEESYGPYLGNDGFCHMNDSNVEIGFQISGFVNVTSGDNEAVKVALAKHGPLSVGIDAAHRSLSFYSNGVYYEPECNNTPDGLDHAVLLVGYGEINGEAYWLIKNSWSTYWGNDGYVLMSQKNNNCGVATAATYVIPK